VDTLVWVDRTGVVQPITRDRRLYEAPRISPDGDKIAVMIEGHIWVYDVARDALARVTFGPNQEFWPIWTPDGSRLTFRRDDPPNIFWQPADGSGDAERLTTSDAVQRPTSWSPDGKMLLWGQGSPTDIGLLTLEGESKTHLLFDTPFHEGGGAFSPDGRFVAYSSNESGRHEVYVRSFPTLSGKWQISTDGGGQPVWARSGAEIFYRSGDKLLAVPIETQPALRAGKPALLFEGRFGGSEILNGPYYDVAPDGERFVMVQNDESGPNQIHVVLNWFTELERRVPTR
jgi:Tol biopolymer transport system component